MKSLRVPLEGHFSAWKKVGEKVSANCEIEPPDSHRLTNWRNWLELTWFDALGELLHPHLPWWNLDILPQGRTPKEQETKTNPKYHPNISQYVPIPKVTPMVDVGMVITECFSYDTDTAAKLQFINCVNLQLSYFMILWFLFKHPHHTMLLTQ